MQEFAGLEIEGNDSWIWSKNYCKYSFVFVHLTGKLNARFLRSGGASLLISSVASSSPYHDKAQLSCGYYVSGGCILKDVHILVT